MYVFFILHFEYMNTIVFYYAFFYTFKWVGCVFMFSFRVFVHVKSSDAKASLNAI